MQDELQIVTSTLLTDYCGQVEPALLNIYRNLQQSGLNTDTFNFYTSVSAVFSSKIEGENIELDSFVKYKRFHLEFLPDYTRKTDDLYNAYLYAQSTPCSRLAIEKAHKIITTHILPAHRQGRIRTGQMYVTTDDGRIEYVAVSPYQVSAELDKFYSDLARLLSAELTVQEVFYYASMLHLVFVKIHPFDDGNGRTSRLIEKWFLAEKLGEQAWLIQSERIYYLQHQTYYQNLRRLGLEYDTLDYTKALPFLTMLPQALRL